MAAIEQTAPSGRRQRMSAKVDFTAMVDLGFLLITFFMLTTSLSKPNIMPIVMPESEGDAQVANKASTVITLLLGGDDKIYFYEGLDNARLDSTNYAAIGLRRVLLDKKSRVDAIFGEKERPDPKNANAVKKYSQTTVLIKALPQSRYKNVVDVFDEMKICAIAHYMLMPVSEAELAFIQHPERGLQFDVKAQLEAMSRQ
jgi:biopolymer transport protein ExbD